MSLPAPQNRPPDQLKIKIGNWLEATASEPYAISVIAVVVAIVVAAYAIAGALR